MSHVFRTPVSLRWSDLDAFNHVNNSRYLTFLEQARIEWFETLDEPWMDDHSAPVVASATLNFKRPIAYPAQVAVELFTDKLGTSSVVIGHRIVAADGTVHCDGQVVAVWVDRQTGKPTPLPPGVRRASERLLPAA
ncbi:MAG: acyl-CoA thioesterase [Xanthomonadales bacterium]|jgi:acyl-CoA thioester hydrolase|uniref:acyl-CoA thioesterase n=1 Tax=Thermomonas sp. TaxID=1971895 RepID=UPI001ACE70CF|nr:acyl-CoA thioesterase [Xanthomonadales bacterium]HMT37752.1 thioesterase family protein [Thermomonas sp.]